MKVKAEIINPEQITAMAAGPLMMRKSLKTGLQEAARIIDEHFDTRQSTWQPHAPGSNRHSKILIGDSGQLRANAVQGEPEIDGDGQVGEIGTDYPLAPIHEFGDDTAGIPARPFYEMDPEDEERILEAAADVIEAFWKNG